MENEEKAEMTAENNENVNCQQNNDNMSVETDKENETQQNTDSEEKTVPESSEDNHTEEKRNKFFGKKSSKEEELKKQLEDLDIKYKELNDRFLRMYSEFDNYKKRTNKEKLELLSTASEKVIVNLLPVIDDYERAIAANEKSEDVVAIKEGFVLIYNKLVQLLKRFNVEEIQAKGEVFNTDFHEAVTHFPTQDEAEKGKVMDVTEKGYKIKDKVIRYAKVVVAN
ncbi:MAG: nucleotide exchange factor GrpE [Bacteroidales bacterium]|nr:nucleotide exchange factor GrpE [Bacteroidales bacterium]